MIPPKPFKAMTNCERQRKFRERHPHYYARLKATQRAATKAASKFRWAQIHDQQRQAAAALKAA